ncbi:MAG: hypothetical protein Rubg2KO_00220 [Rubricoccaceae bacterium]
MTLSFASSKRPLPLALSLGVLGGAVIVLSGFFIGMGPEVMLVYASFILLTFGAVRVAQWPDYGSRFWALFGAFMVATMIHYLYIVLIVRGWDIMQMMPWWGHAWRIGMMAAIGGAISAAGAYLVDLRRA